MTGKVKRISLLVGEEQHQKILDKKLNLSGLVRDLLDDYLGDHKICIVVSSETKEAYDRIIANTGASDEDLEPYLVKAFQMLLKDKIKSIENLEKSLGSKE